MSSYQGWHSPSGEIIKRRKLWQTTMQCILPQNQTTPEKVLSNPWHGKGFCEPSQYKSAIDRCEGGHRSCGLGIEMFTDLSKILENTAASLRQWSTSNQKHINQSKECGTTKKSWLNSVRAVEKLAERHDNVRESIQKTVIDKMTSYKSENYAKSFTSIRKVKEFEKDFKKVQKSWLELIDKVSDAKEALQAAKGKLKSAQQTEKIAESDAGSSDEDKQLAKANVEKRQRDTERYQNKYERAIKDMEKAKSSYESDMYKILERTDEFERKRMEHFNAVFKALQLAVSLDNDKCHTEMATAFKKAIDEHDIAADIDYFNQNFGKGTKNHYPVLEDVKE